MHTSSKLNCFLRITCNPFRIIPRLTHTDPHESNGAIDHQLIQLSGTDLKGDFENVELRDVFLIVNHVRQSHKNGQKIA